MKKFSKYFTLTILLILGLACIGVLYLFFVPNSTLFGIKYINLNSKEQQTFDSNAIDTVIVSSLNYDVDITTTKEDSFILDVYSNTFGFVLTKNSNIEINHSIESNILKINITEPSGFAYKNSSKIKLSIPKDKEINLHLKNKDATTLIDSENLIINNFNYETTNGDCNIAKATINKDFDVTLNKATLKISNEINSSNSNLKLSVTTGKLDATESIFKNITITNNKRGIILFKECNQLSEEIASAGGRIEAEKVSNINVKTSGTNIYIKEISNGAIIDLNSGSVKIDSLSGDNSSILTKTGNIEIANATTSIIVKSNSGNINVAKANATVNVETDSGKININFNTESNETQLLIGKVKDGYINAKGIEKISLTITDSGNADLDISNVIGDSSIKGNTGNINIIINKSSIYKLTTKAQGDVRVNLSQVTQYNGYTDKEKVTYVNCAEGTSTPNALEVTTSGNLTILDTNFA